MDLEKGLVAAILKQGYAAYAERALAEDALSPKARTVIGYIEKFTLQYGHSPDIQLIEKMTGTDFQSVPSAPLAFWIEKLQEKYVFEFMRTLCEEATVLNGDNPIGAFEFVSSKLREFSEQVPSGGNLQSVLSFELWERAVAKIEKGGIGIDTPWPSLTERIGGGWKPQDFVVIAARPGIGKTFAWLMVLLHAWKNGERVLSVTTEMSLEAMVLRATSTATRTSYGRTRKGRLVSYEKSFIMDFLRQAKEDGSADRFMMMGDGFDVYLESIEAKIQTYKPTIVAIDGAYLLKSRAVNEKDRFNRIAEMFNQFKAMAKRNNVPLIITTQLNRGSASTGKTKRGLDRLAFSDNLGMVADFIFFLNQEDDHKECKRMVIEMGKMREGEDYSDLVVNWDFENQNFTEVDADILKREEAMSQTEAKPKASRWGSGIRAPKGKAAEDE